MLSILLDITKFVLYSHWLSKKIIVKTKDSRNCKSILKIQKKMYMNNIMYIKDFRSLEELTIYYI